MLILTRRPGESITIGDGIVLELVAINSWEKRCTFKLLCPDDTSVKALSNEESEEVNIYEEY